MRSSVVERIAEYVGGMLFFLLYYSPYIVIVGASLAIYWTVIK